MVARALGFEMKHVLREARTFSVENNVNHIWTVFNRGLEFAFGCTL